MNRDIATRYTHAVWNDKDLDVIDELIAPDAVIHSVLGDVRGPQSMVKIVKAWLTGFPDLKVTQEAIIGEGDRVAVQWEVSATHKGEFKGFSASGKRISYSGVTVYRVKGGKIVEYWSYIDMNHLLGQLRT